MSYIDINYLNMPSFWSEFFSDKPILDHMYNASLDIVSEAYGRIAKESASLSVYNHPRFRIEEWGLLKAEKSSVIVKTLGEDTYEIVPIDTPIVDFLFLASKPELSKAATVYTKDQAVLVVYAEQSSSLLKNLGIDIRLINKPKLLIVKNGYLLSSSEFTDGIDSTYEVTKYQVLSLPKSFKFSNEYSQISQGTVGLVVDTSVAKYTVIARSAEESDGKVLVYLDTYIDIPAARTCSVTVGSKTYKSDLVAITITEKALNIWAKKARCDYRDLYYRFGFEISSKFLTSTGNTPSLIKSTRQLALEGYTSTNLKRALACAHGSHILSAGEDLNEEILSVDIGSGRIVTSVDVYDHFGRFSINSSILRRANAVLCNSQPTPKQLTYLLNVDYEDQGVTLASILYSLFQEDSINGVSAYLSPAYSRKLRLNNSIYAELLYLGRDYLIIQSASILSSVTKLEVIDKSTLQSVYLLSSEHVVASYLLNNPSGTLSKFSEPTLSTVDIGKLRLEAPQLYSNLYVPENLFNTTYLRRRITLDQYPNIVGSTPLHVVGDYGIYVSEATTYYTPAYYVFKDFLIHNMYYVSYSELDINLGLVPTNVDSLHNLYGTAGTLPLHKQTTSIVTPLYLRVSEDLDTSLTANVSDSLEALQTLGTSVIQDNPDYSKYLQLHFSENIASPAVSITYAGVELGYEYLTSYGTLVEVLLLEDIPGDDVSLIRVDGKQPIDFIRVISVGAANEVLGSWQPLVGSSSPVLSKQANSVINQGKLSSVGPHITIT